jgi:hypothetical protein
MRSPFRQQRIARRVTAPNLPRTRLQRILMNSRPTRLRAELGSPCLRWVTPNRATSAPRRFPLRRSAVSFPSFPLRAVLPFTARQLRRRRRRSAHRARRREAREVLQHQQNLPQEARRDGARGSQQIHGARVARCSRSRGTGRWRSRCWTCGGWTRPSRSCRACEARPTRSTSRGAARAAWAILR